MNERIPFEKKDILMLEEELGISLFPFLNNNIFMLIIPFFLFIFLRNRKSTPMLSVNHYEAPQLPNLNENTLDKMYSLLENFKKASNLHDLKKNMTDSHSSSMKRNMTMFKELLNIFGDSMDENTRSNLQNIQNVISMVDKMKDVKTIMSIKKAFQSAGDDPSAQVNNIVEAIGPMLPKEQVKNIDNFKKIAQMMKLMSLFDGKEDEKDNTNDITIEDKEESFTETMANEKLELLEEDDLIKETEEDE